MLTRVVPALLVFVLFVGLPAKVVAGDVQLWTEAGLRYQINKEFRLKFDQHLRLDQDLSATDSIMPELAVSYRPVKFLRLAAGYRFIAEPLDSGQESYLESWHRFFVDVRLRHRLGPVTLRYRLRLQEQFGFPWAKGEQLTAKHTIRNKIEVELNAGAGIKPFLAGEIFNRIDDADGPFHKWRVGVGLQYTLHDHRLALSYRREEFLFDDPDNETRHIVALGYHYRF